MRLLLQGKRSFFPWITVLLASGLLIGWGFNQRSVAQSLSLINIDPGQQSLQVTVNTLWVVAAGALCFLVIIGLSLLNAGFCRQKNVVNLLTQSLFTLALTLPCTHKLNLD